MENKNLIYFFSAIKNDNVTNFQKIIEQNPEFLKYKNQKKENILFYAFEKNSHQIIDFILKNKNNLQLLTDKNTSNMSILQYLIQKKINIDYFLEKIKILDIEQKKQLLNLVDNQKNNILFMTIKYYSYSNIIRIIEELKNFDLLSSMKNEKNLYQQNILHFLTLYHNDFFPQIVQDIDRKMKFEKDDNNFSPIMIASYKQNFENFIQIYEDNSDFQQILSFGAYNQDEKIIDFLLEQKDINNFQFSENQHPLAIAINKKNIKIIPKILKKLNTKVLPQYFLTLLIKNYNFMPYLIDKIFENYEFEKNIDNHKNILFGAFLNLNFEKLIEIINKNEINIENEQEDLFKNTIIGKKDMVFKINYLLEKGLVINSKTLQYLLMLPKNQIEFILNKTNILNICEENHQEFINFIIDYKNLNIEKKELIVDQQKKVKIEMMNVLTKNCNFFNNKEQFLKMKQYLNTSEMSKLFLKFLYQNESKNILQNIKKYFPLFQLNEKKSIIYELVQNIWLHEKSDMSQYFLKYKKVLIQTFLENIKENKLPKNEKFIASLKLKKIHFIQENEIIAILNSLSNIENSLSFIKKINPLFQEKKLQFDKIGLALIENQYDYNLWNYFYEKVDKQQLFVETFLNYSILRKNISLTEIKNFIKKLENKNDIQKIAFEYCIQENIEIDKFNYFYNFLENQKKIELQKEYLANNYFYHLNLIKNIELKNYDTKLNIKKLLTFNEGQEYIKWLTNSINNFSKEELVNHYNQLLDSFIDEENDIIFVNFLKIVGTKINDIEQKSLIKLLDNIKEKDLTFLQKLTKQYHIDEIFYELIQSLKKDNFYLLEKYSFLFSKENQIIFEKIKLSDSLENKEKNKKVIKI